MSSFQDNFHRDEENKLDYDDSAFYYFSVSLLTVILIPLTISIIKTMITGEKQLDLSSKNCECARCQETIKQRQKVLSKTWMRPGFYFKVGITVALWVVFFVVANHVSQIEPLRSFDPFQILGVETSADI